MFSNGDTALIISFPGPGGRRPPRERLLEAMLVASGELGYEQVAVRHVIERAKTSRATFYKHFDDREDCFAQAYGDAAEWLFRRLSGAAGRVKEFTPLRPAMEPWGAEIPAGSV